MSSFVLKEFCFFLVIGNIFIQEAKTHISSRLELYKLRSRAVLSILQVRYEGLWIWTCFFHIFQYLRYTQKLWAGSTVATSIYFYKSYFPDNNVLLWKCQVKIFHSSEHDSFFSDRICHCWKTDDSAET